MRALYLCHFKQERHQCRFVQLSNKKTVAVKIYADTKSWGLKRRTLMWVLPLTGHV